MPIEPAHASALTTAIAAKAAAQQQLQAALDAVAPHLAEGAIHTVNGPVPGIQKKGGVVRYVMIPGILDADPTPAS